MGPTTTWSRSGVDVGAAGGVYGVTARPPRALRPDRVIDTPIAEAGVLGAAVGAAMAGLRPIAEIMYMDFITVCLDPIVNQAAKLRYMTGGGGRRCRSSSAPRPAAGAAAAPSTRRASRAMLAHVPGLRVYCPADARDAYDLLVAAVRDDGPSASSRTAASTRGGRRLGRASRCRRGARGWSGPAAQLTVVSWGRMVVRDACARSRRPTSVDVELIDLRTLAPLDLETVFAERREDGPLPDRARGGRGVRARRGDRRADRRPGAVRARRADRALRRAQPSPVPYSPALEKRMLPTHESIAARIREVAVGVIR